MRARLELKCSIRNILNVVAHNRSVATQLATRVRIVHTNSVVGIESGGSPLLDVALVVIIDNDVIVVAYSDHTPLDWLLGTRRANGIKRQLATAALRSGKW